MHDENTRKEEKRKKIEIFGIVVTENFPKLMLDTKSQIQEIERTLSKIKYS